MNDSLDPLYKETSTPKKLTAENSEILGIVIKRAREENLREETIEDIIFLCNFFAAPADLSSVRLLKRQATEMIRQLGSAGIIDETTSDRLCASADIFFRLLDQLPRKLRKLVRSLKRGRKSKSPIFAFHLQAMNEKTLSLRRGYGEFALQIHALLRFAERENPERLEVAARLMRYFIHHYRKQKHDPTELTKDIVKRELNKFEEWGADTIGQMSKFIDWLFSGEFPPKKKRPGGYKRRKSVLKKKRRRMRECTVIVDEITFDEDTGIPYTLRQKTFSTPDPEGIRQGESPEDYIKDVQLQMPGSPFEDKPTDVTRRRFMHRLNYCSRPRPWHRKFKKLHDLSLLYMYLAGDNAE